MIISNAEALNQYIKELFAYWDGKTIILSLFQYRKKSMMKCKKIHSDLCRYLRKRYFELSADQLVKISEFFKKYPGGVIVFG